MCLQLLQFHEELASFASALQARRLMSCSPCAVPQREDVRFDVISVGDQLCEITAAIRLGVSNSSIIRHTKLLMILDLMSDRFASTSPEHFVLVSDIQLVASDLHFHSAFRRD